MSEEAANQPAQGWYPDPQNASQLRWWDGSAWTEHVHAADPAAGGTAQAGQQLAAGQATQAQSAQAAQATQAQAQSAQATPSRAGVGGSGIVSNPAPRGGGSGSSAGRSPIAEWLSVRSNQALLAVLIIAVILFAIVMLGGAS